LIQLKVNIQPQASATLLRGKEPPVSIEWVGVRSLNILYVLEKKKKIVSYLYT